MNGRNTTVIQIRVRDEIADTYKALAKLKGCTVSDIIRPLLLDYRYKLFQEGVLDKDGKVRKNDRGNIFPRVHCDLTSKIERIHSNDP